MCEGRQQALCSAAWTEYKATLAWLETRDGVHDTPGPPPWFVLFELGYGAEGPPLELTLRRLLAELPAEPEPDRLEPLRAAGRDAADSISLAWAGLARRVKFRFGRPSERRPRPPRSGPLML